MVIGLGVRAYVVPLCVTLAIACAASAWAGEVPLAEASPGVTADTSGDRVVWGQVIPASAGVWQAGLVSFDLLAPEMNVIQSHSGSASGTGVAAGRVSGERAVSWAHCLDRPEDDPSLKVWDYVVGETVLSLPARVDSADIDGDLLAWADCGGLPPGQEGGFDLTRAGVAYLVACGLTGGEQSVPDPPAGAQTFPDIPPDYWAYRYVEYCAQQNIMQGYWDGNFHPERGLNRGQMAVYVARALAGGEMNIPDGPLTPTFADVPADSLWYRYVEYLNSKVTNAAYSTVPEVLFAPDLPQSALIAQSWVEQGTGTWVSAWRILELELGIAPPALRARDMVTGEERLIAEPAALPAAVAVSGNRVVWQDARNANWDIYLCDVDWGMEQQTPTRITDNVSDQANPAISGDVLVWQDSRNGNWDIYLYRLPVTPTTTAGVQLTVNPADQMMPSVSGDLVVYQDNRNGNWDIYLYDLSADTETQLTTDPADQTDPRIDGQRVVYTDTRSGIQIYLNDLGVAPPAADFTADVLSGTPPLTVHFSDLTTGGQLWQWSWDFGDGCGSPEQHPTHEYQDFGIYTVSLAVAGPGGTDVETRAGYVVVTFSDVPVGYPALPEIMACVEADIVQGYWNNTYKPAVIVNRGQMAIYIARAVAGGESSVPGPPTGRQTFPDVPFTGYGPDGTQPHPSYKYVEYCFDQSIVQGYSDGSYKPDRAVNRGQMAIYIARGILAPGGDQAVPEPLPGQQTFPDVAPDSEWAGCFMHVEYIAGLGVVQGYQDGGYHPERTVRRDQMALYVARGFDLPM